MNSLISLLIPRPIALVQSRAQNNVTYCNASHVLLAPPPPPFSKDQKNILFWVRFVKPPILDLQPISRESPDNAARPLRLVPTIELIKYSFVPHHQHGQRPSQEFLIILLSNVPYQQNLQLPPPPFPCHSSLWICDTIPYITHGKIK